MKIHPEGHWCFGSFEAFVDANVKRPADRAALAFAEAWAREIEAEIERDPRAVPTGRDLITRFQREAAEALTVFTGSRALSILQMWWVERERLLPERTRATVSETK